LGERTDGLSLRPKRVWGGKGEVGGRGQELGVRGGLGEFRGGKTQQKGKVHTPLAKGNGRQGIGTRPQTINGGKKVGEKKALRANQDEGTAGVAPSGKLGRRTTKKFSGRA